MVVICSADRPFFPNAESSPRMPEFVAIVSKAVFEKEAKGLGIGEVWPTDAYASSSRALAPLASGGSLFLVTVRPSGVLWLVAILDNPVFSRDAYRAEANVTPIHDLTDVLASL